MKAAFGPGTSSSLSCFRIKSLACLDSIDSFSFKSLGSGFLGLLLIILSVLHAIFVNLRSDGVRGELAHAAFIKIWPIRPAKVGGAYGELLGHEGIQVFPEIMLYLPKREQERWRRDI